MRAEALQRSDRVVIRHRMIHTSGRVRYVHDHEVPAWEAEGWILADN